MSFCELKCSLLGEAQPCACSSRRARSHHGSEATPAVQQRPKESSSTLSLVWLVAVASPSSPVAAPTVSPPAPAPAPSPAPSPSPSSWRIATQADHTSIGADKPAGETRPGMGEARVRSGQVAGIGAPCAVPCNATMCELCMNDAEGGWNTRSSKGGAVPRRGHTDRGADGARSEAAP